MFSASNFLSASMPIRLCCRTRAEESRFSSKVYAVTATITATPSEETITEYALPSWTIFELGKAPVYWKTMSGLPPSSIGKLILKFVALENIDVTVELFSQAGELSGEELDKLMLIDEDQTSLWS